MAIKTYYTAIGRFERHTKGGLSYPVILLSGKEYMVDLQEMVVWTALNWRLAHKEQIGGLYAEAVAQSHFSAQRTWEDCLARLVTRGLVVSGSGDTDYDAMYDLLSNLTVIPVGGGLVLRVLAFCRLVLCRHISARAAARLFRRDHRTAPEQQVMALACQAQLSTAEIIRCVDRGITLLPSEESIVLALYSDPDLTSENLGFAVKPCKSSESVLLAVANLYLRQQILFDRG